ncbi:MAG: ABC transporter ATP-binding protein [Clostridia bacterium]|nr:ABC transporter ATP-binding protein [Clostridia bacterium]
MIKQLAKSIREYKLPSLLAPLFITLEVVMEVLLPNLMSDLIDNGVDKGDMNYILKTGLILAGVAFAALAFGALSGRFAAQASAGFAKNLRHDLFYKLQEYSFSNIDKFSASSLVTRLTTDVTNVQNAYQMIIRVAFRAPFMMIFAMIMSFTMNAQLSWVFVAFIPFIALALGIVTRFAHPIFSRVFKTYDKLNNVVQENLHGIRVVKSFVREEHEVEKFNKISDLIYKDFSKAEKIVAFNMPVMQISVYACILIISWFASHQIVGGTMTTGELISMMTYVFQILMSLMFISMTMVMITMSRASGERIAEVLTEEVDLKNNEDPLTEIQDGSIEFNNVSFSYAKNMEKLCLKDISLKINSGETVGIIGGTGSSKSSLVQLIPRLYDVTQGTVTVGGADVRNYDIEALRDSVAMVLQKNVLFSGTIKENLRWGKADATDEEIVKVCRQAQAEDFIERMPDKYDTYIEQGGTNVSGGQRQRLCIARALLKKPKILILDDSTSAVDTKTDRLIRKAFLEEIPDTTKIIIAQRVSSVEDADKIIVMDKGMINAVGTHEELLKTNKIYQEVYYSQQKGSDENG